MVRFGFNFSLNGLVLNGLVKYLRVHKRFGLVFVLYKRFGLVSLLSNRTEACQSLVDHEYGLPALQTSQWYSRITVLLVAYFATVDLLHINHLSLLPASLFILDRFFLLFTSLIGHIYLLSCPL